MNMVLHLFDLGQGKQKCVLISCYGLQLQERQKCDPQVINFGHRRDKNVTPMSQTLVTGETKMCSPMSQTGHMRDKNVFPMSWTSVTGDKNVFPISWILVTGETKM